MSARLLEGKAGIVTGGASGIGRELAAACAAAGARVAILDVEDAAGACADAGPGTLALTADVTDAEGVDAAFDAALTELGALDFLINDAGVRQHEPFETFPLEAWRRTIDVNLTGTFICSQAAVRRMLPRGGGSIVNLGSIAGELALTQRAAYNASKAAIHMLTRSIAADLAGRGIRCNAIAPGVIETPLSAPYFQDERMREILVSGSPSGRWGTPPDIAGPAIFLCSDLAAHVHGQVLFVDGGWTAAKGY